MDFQSILNRAFEHAPAGENGDKDLKDIAFSAYKIYVESCFPYLVGYCPVIAGRHYKLGIFDKYYVVVLIDEGPTSLIQTLGIGNIKLNLNEIDRTNPHMIRKELFSLLNLKKRDAIFLFDKTNNYSNWRTDLERDLKENFLQHKMVMNMEPMKIFLSHKSINKDKVRNFKTILELLGFSPWLDEEAMSAGANLERSLQSGMTDSCAAIFFITPDYKDEKYLASEIDYAISRKRQDEKFSIITLVFSDENEKKGVVPNLLQPYVWKEPTNDLIALAEILKALEVGDIRFK